jgi:hypothetical protein
MRFVGATRVSHSKSSNGHLGGAMVSMLAIGPKVCGFKPGLGVVF